jgi:hypothetical protein
MGRDIKSKTNMFLFMHIYTLNPTVAGVCILNSKRKAQCQIQVIPLETLEVPEHSPGSFLLASFPQRNNKLMAWITPSVKGETEHQAAPGGSGFEF